MRTLVAAAAAALALAAHAQLVGPPVRYPPIDTEPKKSKEKRDPPKAPEYVRPDVETVSGEIRALDWSARRITLDAAGEPLGILVDRNTMVFLEARQGTLRDLTVGLPVRASVTGPEKLATWVEVRQPAGDAPTPAEGGPAAGQERSGAVAVPGTPGGTGETGGGASSPGGGKTPPSPSPLPPSSAPVPGTPAGPGPVPGGGPER